VGSAPSARPGNYAEQARTFDLTRGASPTIVRSLVKHLGRPNGRSMLDVAGGTGNYAMALAARGFHVSIVDASPEMLAHAARKMGSGRCVAGDAERLPIRDAACDAAMMVNCIHLLADPQAALGEARRVIRAGPLLLTAFTRENLAALFVYEYFGLAAPPTRRPPIAQFEAWLHEAGFGRIEHEIYIYTDTVDGSLNALHTNAMHLAGPAYLRNTSFWFALDEESRRRGLEALARDLRSGTLEQRVQESFREAVEHGHGALFAAWP
jgi:ubiquinone/menaquinone biosynthesis C-methylase UbiE